MLQQQQQLKHIFFDSRHTIVIKNFINQPIIDQATVSQSLTTLQRNVFIMKHIPNFICKINFEVLIFNLNI